MRQLLHIHVHAALGPPWLVAFMVHYKLGPGLLEVLYRNSSPSFSFLSVALAPCAGIMPGGKPWQRWAGLLLRGLGGSFSSEWNKSQVVYARKQKGGIYVSEKGGIKVSGNSNR